MESQSAKKRLPRLILGLFLGFAFSVFSLYVKRMLLLLDPPGVISQFMLAAYCIVFTVPGLLFLPAIVAFCFLLVRSIMRRQWHNLYIYIPAFLISAFSLTASSYMNPLLERAQVNAAGRTAQKGKAIVDALEQYHRKNGKYPQALTELVPDYLPQIPGTGMFGHPDFTYRLPDPNDKYDKFSGYEIRVSMAWLFDFDSLHYWPEGNNRDVFGKAGTKVAGDWVFFDD